MMSYRQAIVCLMKRKDWLDARILAVFDSEESRALETAIAILQDRHDEDSNDHDRPDDGN